MTFRSSFFICALTRDLSSALVTTRDTYLIAVERKEIALNQMFEHQDAISWANIMKNSGTILLNQHQQFIILVHI